MSITNSHVAPPSDSLNSTEEHAQGTCNTVSDPISYQSHHHNESTSTSASTSESTGSSPTTTLSLPDDSSVKDMFPGSLPESPPPKTLALRPHTADESASQSFFERSAPGKRPRNLKNLAVNTRPEVGGLRGAVTALPKHQPNDTQTRPSTAHTGFKHPTSPPKRRPSNLSLTIVTSANNSPANSAVPPTPSLNRPTTLRHFQSSPDFPVTPTSPMTADPDRPGIERSFSDIPSSGEHGFNFDIPQSREEQPDAYPDGPICVVEPYVDLYLEPTAEQASQYDVILNVASEVRNPFLQYTTPDPTIQAIRLDGGGGLQLPPRRPTASSATKESDTSKATNDADTYQKHTTTGPTQPEYIHIPWEHNSDIVHDLFRLVCLVDDRVKRGKRILIHCQCGVSRSATLVVAYCMYKHPQHTVQQAYDMIKKRSRWIGPNMNLIMQLQEFSSILTGTRRPHGHLAMRTLTPIEASATWNEWRRDSAMPPSHDDQAPMTAPLFAPSVDVNRSIVSLTTPLVTPGPSSAPSGMSFPRQLNPAESVPRTRPTSMVETSTGTEDQYLSTDRRQSSERKRPKSLLWETTNIPTIVEPTITAIPEVAVTTSSDGTASPDQETHFPLASPRSEEFAMTALQPSEETSSEDHFGVMSPSTSTFSHSPFDRAALLGLLGMGASIQPRMPPDAPRPHPVVQVATGIFPGMQRLGLADPLLSPRAGVFTSNPFAGPLPLGPLPSDDPRSPAQQGTSPIVRNIADAL